MEFRKNHRHLREGGKYEGFESLERSLEITKGFGEMRPAGLRFQGRPTLSECLGPHNKNEFLLNSADFEALRLRAKTVDFIGPSKEAVYNLFNEMAMTYLERFVILVFSTNSLHAAATALLSEARHTEDCRPFCIRPPHWSAQGFDSWIRCHRG